MNENLTNRILQYLELETNYAIIINGDYGIGKTYYIKNELFPKVKNIQIPNSTKEEKFYPIPISLFGVNTIDEIQNQIFIELYPILKNKGIKIASGLGKSVFKFFSGSDFKEFLSDINTSSSDLIDFGKIMLCIDDIDRKSKDLDLIEVFGFVNNLVENLNAKIILIANEDELRKEVNIDTDNYSVLKEKVIGISINFQSDVSSIFNQVIKNKYKSKHKDYFDFLNFHKELIVKRIEQNKGNLRNLLFFLEHFKVIYNDISEYFLKETKFDSLKPDIYFSVIDFVLPIAIEYKMGKLNSSNFENIQEIYQGTFISISSLLNPKTVDETPKTYSDEYREKYILNRQTKKFYSDVIFKYITGSNTFLIDQFSDELNLIYKFEDNKIPEREQVLNKLNYWSCVDLKYKDYKSLTNKMLDFVDKGEYTIEQYPTIFHYALRFDNLLRYNIDKLKHRFKKGILKGQKNYQYISDFHFKISIDKSSEFYDVQIEILEFCNQLNGNLKKSIETKKTGDLFDLFMKDFDAFIDKIEDNNNEFHFTPFFVKFNFDKTWNRLKKLTNTQLINFGFYLRGRYRVQIYNGLLPEKEFLTSLELKIKEDLVSNKTLKMKKVALNFLHVKVKESIGNFPE
jgi:hypothetical protein